MLQHVSIPHTENVCDVHTLVCLYCLSVLAGRTLFYRLTGHRCIMFGPQPVISPFIGAARGGIRLLLFVGGWRLSL